MKKLSFAILGATLVCAIPYSLQWSQEKGLTVSDGSADARVGRPLTPVSVAGVHRRAHRRAYHYSHGHRVYY